MKYALIEAFEAMVVSALILALAFCAFTLFMSFAEAADVTTTIRQEAIRQGFDPKLAIAIATVESSLNPHAKGSHGEVGLFQLRPEFHGRDVNTSSLINVRAGIRYLSRVRAICSRRMGAAFFVCFNFGETGGLKLREPTKTEYYKRVMALYRGKVK